MDRTILEQKIQRSLKIDEEFLKTLEIFLKKDFSVVLFSLKTNKRHLSDKLNLGSFLVFLNFLDKENIEYVEVFAYKNNTQTGCDLEIIFRKYDFVQNIEYKFKDGFLNSDVGFLQKLEDFLCERRFIYYFIHDDTTFIPFHAKVALKVIVLLGLIFYVYDSYFKVFFESNFLYYASLFLCYFYVNMFFNYLFPKFIITLTKKEVSLSKKRNFITKAVRWLILLIIGALILKILRLG